MGKLASALGVRKDMAEGEAFSVELQVGDLAGSGKVWCIVSPWAPVSLLTSGQSLGMAHHYCGAIRPSGIHGSCGIAVSSAAWT
jgi:hypothetical protein